MLTRRENGKIGRDLRKAAEGLVQAERSLPSSVILGPSECDDWCKLWMLLVGTWYSLCLARSFLQKEPLKCV